MKKLVNGKLVDLTKKEIDQRKAEESAHQDWLENVKPKEEAKAELSQTDKDMARVAEDAIETLHTVLQDLDPNISFHDRLPPKAQETLNKRKQLREKL